MSITRFRVSPLPSVQKRELRRAVLRGDFHDDESARAALRDGVACSVLDTKEWVLANWPGLLIGHSGEEHKQEDEGSMANLDERFDEATAKIESAYARFDAARARFKGEMKNDAAQLSAGADKITAQIEKVQRTLGQLLAMMSAGDMQTAIANAERLATALEKINGLASNRVTFSVIAPGPKDQQ